MPETRSEVLKVRCTPTEKARLEHGRNATGVKNLSDYVRSILFPSSPRGGGSSSGDAGPRKRNAPGARGRAGSIPAPEGETTSQDAGRLERESGKAPPVAESGDKSGSPPGVPAETSSEAVRAPEAATEPVSGEDLYIARRTPTLIAAGDSPAVARALARQEFKRGKR